MTRLTGWKKPVKKVLRGFSLAELLIALLIIGEISTFTIPKILSSQQNGQKKLVFKETISALSAIAGQAYMMNEVREGYHGTYFVNNLNALKVCETHSANQGCWTHASALAETHEPGFIMHNGATLAGFNNNAAVFNAVIMDWNGPAGPNIEGDDQMILYYDFGSAKRGRVEPAPTSRALFEWVFQ